MIGIKGISQLLISLRFGTLTFSRLSGEIEFKTTPINNNGGILTSGKLATLDNASNAGGEKSVS